MCFSVYKQLKLLRKSLNKHLLTNLIGQPNGPFKNLQKRVFLAEGATWLVILEQKQDCGKSVEGRS